MFIFISRPSYVNAGVSSSANEWTNVIDVLRLKFVAFLCVEYKNVCD